MIFGLKTKPKKTKQNKKKSTNLTNVTESRTKLIAQRKALNSQHKPYAASSSKRKKSNKIRVNSNNNDDDADDDDDDDEEQTDSDDDNSNNANDGTNVIKDCSVCLDKPARVAFLPCGHLVFIVV